jgi:hypothetical protein
MNSTIPDENDIVFQTYGLDIVSLIRAVYDLLVGGDFDAFLERLSHWWDIYSIIAILLSLVFIVGFVYAKIRYAELKEIEQKQLREAEAMWAHVYGGGRKANSRWEDVLAHVKSENPNDWRLAIIEADIMLEEALDKAGYVGVTIGDKLKTANPESMRTLHDAWEAHKVRNQIAHAGTDFVLTKKTTQETVTRYERVFTEFGTI